MTKFTMTTLTLVADAGLNAHKQRLVLAQCSCGSPAFICRKDSFKQGRTKSCGCVRNGKPSAKPALVAAPLPAPEIESTFERGSIAYFDDEISRRDAALTTYENHIRFLDTESAQEEAVNLDTLKKRKAASSYANDLRQEISRLRIEKANAETAVKKDDKTAVEITKERIAALKGKR
jgi:hypothetical protein